MFATTDGERNTFAAWPLGFSTLVRERKTCPAATACVHFWNITSASATDFGPNLTFELVDGSNRTVVVRDLLGGEDGPAEAPFVFDTETGTTEIPWTDSTSPLRLSVREATATAPFVDVEIPNAPGGLFTLWIVGKTGASGPATRRAVLCRDSDPDDGSFTPCTTVAP
jgi:hypothetical protein